jgi:hypothetical protein
LSFEAVFLAAEDQQWSCSKTPFCLSPMQNMLSFYPLASVWRLVFMIKAICVRERGASSTIVGMHDGGTVEGREA